MPEFHKYVYSVLREYLQYHSGVWIFVDALRAISWCSILHVL